ncbi:MAG: hypothetical protein R2856_22625 [Caldilineaceae bacterium]
MGISRATLYAYVSRGWCVLEETGGDSRPAAPQRRRRGSTAGTQGAARADPTLAAQQALDWGTPILESALTLIAEGHFYYRGQDATELARVHTLEEVAGLFWADDLNADLFGEPLRCRNGCRGCRCAWPICAPWSGCRGR